MASNGPNAGGTFANDTAVGTIAWANPSNASASDNVRATAALATGEISNYLNVTNFGFSIPSAAKITGIELRVEKQKGGAGDDALDNAVRLIKDGSIGATDRSTTDLWDDGDTVTVYGGEFDMWSDAWTPTDVNKSTFGAAISGKETESTSPTIAIDFVSITVYFFIPTAQIPRRISRGRLKSS